jgi:hypothetical protein
VGPDCTLNPGPDSTLIDTAVAIAEAAKRLNELRETWLNPSDLVRRVPEVVPGYPDRLLQDGLRNRWRAAA